MFIHSQNYNHGSSYLIDKLKDNKYLINYHFYGDILSRRDKLSLLKRIFDKSSVILFSCESQEHSWHYKRPSFIANAYFTHLSTKNSIFYTLFFEEALSSGIFYQKQISNQDKNGRTLLTASNNAKIERFKSKYPEVFDQVDLYGHFSKEVPKNYFFSDTINDGLTNLKNYIYDSQLLSSKYSSVVCLDNSFENGYFQGTPMMHLYANTVPIYDGPKYWSNFIKEEFIIKLSEYSKLTPKEKKSTINRTAAKIENAEGNFLTTLSIEYLDFLKTSLSSDNIDFQYMIKESIYFREKFLKVESP